MAATSQGMTKQSFLAGTQCRTAGWFVRNGGAEQSPTPGQQLRMDEGQEVGRKARNCFPDGVLINAANPAQAAAETQRLMNGDTVETIFEATFHADGYTAKADILRRTGDGWHLIEVKSAKGDTPDLVDDLAYTAMVMGECGVEAAKASLWLISGDYRLGMPDKDLFVEVDHTADVYRRVGEFLPLMNEVKAETEQADRPEPTLSWICKDCPFFKTDCLSVDVDDHVFELPRIGEKKFAALTDEGITTIPEIPDGFPLTDNQERVRQCVISGEPEINEAALMAELGRILYPAYYLDFETVATTLPLYPDIPPYAQVPTQYSLHRCDDLGAAPRHVEFLAPEPTRDCRRDLAEHLLAYIGEMGSVIVYHQQFEKGVIRALAEQFPDLGSSLLAINDRIVDLKVVLSKGIYHPGFHGSNSIKKTLPVLVPEMSYDGLDIGDGETAVAMFARMAMGQFSPTRERQMRRDLLAYCKLDTLAMVRLHERLAELADGGG